MEKGQNVSLVTFISVLRALDALWLLSAFISKPEISPIAYAKLLEGRKPRMRASGLKNEKKKITNKNGEFG